MSAAACRVGLGIAVFACATMGHAQTHSQSVIAYDAKTGEFSRRLRPMAMAATTSPALPLDRSPFYDASDTVSVEIDHARCDDAFKVEITEHEVAEVKAEVRGLDDAAGLITGVLGAPPAKGGADDGLTLPEVGTLVDRLSDAQGAEALQQELEEDLHHLQMSLELHQRARDEYARRVKELMALAIPRLKAKTAAVSAITHQPAALTRCEQLWPLVQAADEMLAEVRVARARISDRLESRPDLLLADLDLLTKRARTYQDKLERVRRAAELARQILGATAPERACDRGPCLPIAAVLARQKRLKEAFGEVAGEDALRQVVEEYMAFRRKDREWLQTLLDELSEATDPDGRDTLAAKACALEFEARQVAVAVRKVRDDFADVAREIDQDVGSRLDEVNGAYENHRMTRVVAVVGPYATNQALIVKVSGKRPTQRPRGSSATLTGPPTASADGAPSDDFVEIASKRFDFHKSYRWSIAGAVAGSSRKEPTFAVRSVPRRDASGQQVKDADGNTITDLKPTQVGEESTLDYPLLLHYYFRKQDVFPGTARGGATWGLTGGVSIPSPEDDQYLGLFVQPTAGVQLIGGLNLARRTRLQDGVTADITVLDPGTTDPPTIKERHVGAFFGVALDIRIFKRFFGGGS